MSYHEGTPAQFATWHAAAMLAEGIPRAGTTAYCTPIPHPTDSEKCIWFYGPYRDYSKNSRDIPYLKNEYPVLDPFFVPLPEGAIPISFVYTTPRFFHAGTDVVVDQVVTLGGYVDNPGYNGEQTVTDAGSGWFDTEGLEYGSNESGGYFIP